MTVASLMPKTTFWLMKKYIYQFYLSIVSSRISFPPWHIDFTHFYLHPPLKNILNLSDPSPPPLPSPPHLWATMPHNFGEPDSPVLNVPSSKKNSTHSNIKKDYIWMLKYEHAVAKSKNWRRLRCFLSISFLLGS